MASEGTLQMGVLPRLRLRTGQRVPCPDQETVLPSEKQPPTQVASPGGVRAQWTTACPLSTCT